MSFRFQRFAWCIVLVWVACVRAWGEDTVFSHDQLFKPSPPPSFPLSHLVESVERLRTKKIPQAYFWLMSPQVSDSTIFVPDGKGGGFVVIGRVFALPDGVDPQVELTRINKERPASKPLLLDNKNRRLLHYSDENWKHLVKVIKAWTVEHRVIEGITWSNQWKMERSDLIIRIPKENTDDFLKTLLKAWRTDPENFRCLAGWN